LLEEDEDDEDDEEVAERGVEGGKISAWSQLSSATMVTCNAGCKFG
jgi:hypothetical protein